MFGSGWKRGISSKRVEPTPWQGVFLSLTWDRYRPLVTSQSVEYHNGLFQHKLAGIRSCPKKWKTDFSFFMKSLLTGQRDFVGKVWYNLGLSHVWASPLTFTYIPISGLLLFFPVLKILSHLLDASHLHRFHWRRSLCDTRQETGRPAPSLEELVKSCPSCVDGMNESIVARHRFHMLHPQKRFEHLQFCGFWFFFFFFFFLTGVADVLELVTPQSGEGRQTTNFIVSKRRKSRTIKGPNGYAIVLPLQIEDGRMQRDPGERGANLPDLNLASFWLSCCMRTKGTFQHIIMVFAA